MVEEDVVAGRSQNSPRPSISSKDKSTQRVVTKMPMTEKDERHAAW
jgi:hypothetical protein